MVSSRGEGEGDRKYTHAKNTSPRRVKGGKNGS